MAKMLKKIMLHIVVHVDIQKGDFMNMNEAGSLQGQYLSAAELTIIP